jgi:hypothetical protein
MKATLLSKVYISSSKYHLIDNVLQNFFKKIVNIILMTFNKINKILKIKKTKTKKKNT